MTSDSVVALASESRLLLDPPVSSVMKKRPNKANTRSAPHISDSEMAEHDPLTPASLAEVVERTLHASIAPFTAGLSPAALALAYFDWATHLAAAPGKRIELADKAARKAIRLFDYAGRCVLERGATGRCIESLPQDRRFVGELWQQFPFSLVHQGFLLNQQWWHAATTGIRRQLPRKRPLRPLPHDGASDVAWPVTGGGRHIDRTVGDGQTLPCADGIMGCADQSPGAISALGRSVST